MVSKMKSIELKDEVLEISVCGMCPFILYITWRTYCCTLLDKDIREDVAQYQILSDCRLKDKE